jgi:hypothetical protein
MGLGFTAMLVGIVIRLSAKKTAWWFKTHHTLGWIGAFSGAAGLILGIIMIALTHGYHLRNLHAVIGAVTLAFILVSFCLMASLKSVKKEAKGRVKITHRIFGWITMPLMAFTIILGLRFVGLI